MITPMEQRSLQVARDRAREISRTSSRSAAARFLVRRLHRMAGIEVAR